MASIVARHLDDDKTKEIVGWQAKVRMKGHPAQTKTFLRKTDADAWASAVETDSALARPR